MMKVQTDSEEQSKQQKQRVFNNPILQKVFRQTSQLHRIGFFTFVPGMFFLLLGVAVLLAPHFMVALLSSVLVFLGVVFCYLAWRFQQLRKRFQSTVDELRGKVMIQGFAFEQPYETADPEFEDPEDPGDMFH